MRTNKKKLNRDVYIDNKMFGIPKKDSIQSIERKIENIRKSIRKIENKGDKLMIGYLKNKEKISKTESLIDFMQLLLPDFRKILNEAEDSLNEIKEITNSLKQKIKVNE